MNESKPFTGTQAPTQPRWHDAERALARACLRIPPLRHWGRRLLAKSHTRSVEWHERSGTRVPCLAANGDNGESLWD